MSTVGLVGSYVDQSLGFYSVRDDWRVSQLLSGERIDRSLNFPNGGWGSRSEVGLTSGDEGNWEEFSVQWDGHIEVLNSGLQLLFQADDSSRLWIDLNGDGSFDASGPEFLNHGWGSPQLWTLSPATEPIAAGRYAIRVQYQETFGANVLHLLDASTIVPGFRLLGVFAGRQYFMSLPPMMRTAAQDSAAAWTERSGVKVNLATIRSVQHQDWLRSQTGDVESYIGLNSSEKAGVWRWDGGEPFSFAFWGPGEPNGFLGIEEFVLMNWFDDGSWNDGAGNWDPAHSILEVANGCPEPGVELAAADLSPDAGGRVRVSWPKLTSPGIAVLRLFRATEICQLRELATPDHVLAPDATEVVDIVDADYQPYCYRLDAVDSSGDVIATLFSSHAVAYPNLVISEIFAASGSLASFTLRNPGPEPVSLFGLRLTHLLEEQALNQNVLQAGASTTIPSSFLNLAVGQPILLLPPSHTHSDFRIDQKDFSTGIYSTAQPNSGLRIRAGLPLRVEVFPPLQEFFLDGTLYYRRGGESAYSTSALTLSGPLPSATIPEDYVTGRGIEYWVEMHTNGGVRRDPPVADPASAPRQVRVLTGTLSEPEMAPPFRYRMISIPAEFETPGITFADLLSPQLGPYARENWRLFSHDSISGNEVEWSAQAASQFLAAPGKSAWLVTRGAHRFEVTSVEAISTPSVGPFAVPVEPGWNQIANPFSFPVAWSDVARSSAIGDPQFYEADPDSSVGYQTTGVLEPYGGYFVFNGSTSTDTLLIAPRESTSVSPIPRTEALWSIRLEAAADNGVRAAAHLGVHTSAASHSIRRLRPPLPPGTSVSLGLLDNAGRAGMLYSEVLRPNAPSGQKWSAALRTPRAGERVILRCLVNGMPANYRVVVVDPQTSTREILDGSGAIEVLSPGPERDYEITIVVGTEDFLREFAPEPDLPARTLLHQNAPNPFNPATRILFELAEPAKVELSVFNLRGEWIRAIIKEDFLPAGSHSRIWTGLDKDEHPVASGVYVYDLIVDGRRIASRKMSLIR